MADGAWSKLCGTHLVLALLTRPLNRQTAVFYLSLRGDDDEGNNVDCYCNTAVKVREKPATITKAMHLKIMRPCLNEPRFDADQEDNMMRVLNHNA